VQRDELAAIPDSLAGYRALLIDAFDHLASPIPTSGFVIGISRLDHASLFSDADAERHRAFVGSDNRRAKDALILLTAARQGIPVVTMESKPRKVRRMEHYFPEVELWSMNRFLAFLDEHALLVPPPALEWPIADA
jgi:hypothetical protein